jgi:hypothetical protein
MADSRHGEFVPFVRRLKRCTSRDKGHRQKHSPRAAANDVTTDFAFRFRLFLHSSLKITQQGFGKIVQSLFPLAPRIL